MNGDWIYVDENTLPPKIGTLVEVVVNGFYGPNKYTEKIATRNDALKVIANGTMFRYIKE
jgi:hypothetical protein